MLNLFERVPYIKKCVYEFSDSALFIEIEMYNENSRP